MSYVFAQEVDWKALVDTEQKRLLDHYSERDPEVRAICTAPSYEGAPSPTSTVKPTPDDLAKTALMQSMKMALERQYQITGSPGESQKAVAQVLEESGCDVAAVGAVPDELWVRTDAFSLSSANSEDDKALEWFQADQTIESLLLAAEHGGQTDVSNLLGEGVIEEARTSLQYVEYGTECAAVLSEVEALCTGDNGAWQSFLSQTSNVDPSLAEGFLTGAWNTVRKGILTKALTPTPTAGPDKDQFTEAERRQEFEDRVDRGIQELREAAREATDKAPSMRTNEDLLLIYLTEMTIEELEEFKRNPSSFQKDPDAPVPVPTPDPTEVTTDFSDAFENYKRTRWDPQLASLLRERRQCLGLSGEYSEPVQTTTSPPAEEQCDVIAATRALNEAALPRTSEGQIDYEKMARERDTAKARDEKRFLASDDWVCDYDRFSEEQCKEEENEYYVRQGYSGAEEFCMLHPSTANCKANEFISEHVDPAMAPQNHNNIDIGSEHISTECLDAVQNGSVRTEIEDCEPSF
jgi:hypothetical protein